MKIIRNKKGSISIVGIIVSLIIVTALAGYTSLLNSSWVYNEVQSIMDLCSTNALQNSIDTDALRKEILGVIDPSQGESTSSTSVGTDGQWANKVNNAKINSILKGLYEDELDANMSINDMITNIRLVSFESTLEYTDWGAVYDGDALNRPQLIMDAVVQITIKTHNEFDAKNHYNKQFFDAKSNSDFTISVNEIAEDGKIILTVRTLSRILYK